MNYFFIQEIFTRDEKKSLKWREKAENTDYVSNKKKKSKIFQDEQKTTVLDSWGKIRSVDKGI